MSDVHRAYRVATATGDEWFDTLAAAESAIAARLAVSARDVAALQRRVSTDPVVIRRDDGRWRSAGTWLYKSAAGSVRVIEMIRVDEAQYDHDH